MPPYAYKYQKHSNSMIDFNLSLQTLSECHTRLGQLRKLFATVSSTQLVTLLAGLDIQNKGYLTHTEIVKNANSDLLQFMNRKFECRVTYTMLACYLQALGNDSGMALRGDRLELAHVAELLQIQCQMDRLRAQALGKMGLYVMGTEGKIGYKQFEEYCHCQKLAINPETVFGLLAGGQKIIEVGPAGGEGKVGRQQQINLSETSQRINRLQSTLERLEQRADKFGLEWL